MKEIIFLRKPRQNLRKHVHEGNVLKNKIINELRKLYCKPLQIKKLQLH